MIELLKEARDVLFTIDFMTTPYTEAYKTRLIAKLDEALASQKSDAAEQNAAAQESPSVATGDSPQGAPVPVAAAPHSPDAGTPKPEEIQEWIDHLDLHVTEHDLSHAGKALRAAWPQVKQYYDEQLTAALREREEAIDAADFEGRNAMLLQQRAEEAERRAEKLQKDANRYRWLRVNSTQPAEGWSTHSNPESLDQSIDAAMRDAAGAIAAPD